MHRTSNAPARAARSQPLLPPSLPCCLRPPHGHLALWVTRAGGSNGPEPGSVRKGTARDAARLAKIFGPSRYPAFVPDESLLGNIAPPPPPPRNPAQPQQPQQPAQQQPQPAGRPAVGRARPISSAAATAAAARPLSGFGAAAGAAGARGSSGAGAAVGNAQAVIRDAKHWRELGEMLAAGSQLGAATLVALSKRLEQLAVTKPPIDEREFNDLRQLGEKLCVATRMYLGASYSLVDVCSVLRAVGTCGVAPTENWLLAVELASAGTMQDLLQEFRVAADAATSGSSELAAACRTVYLGIKEVLQLVAGLLAVGYQPRDDWLQLFVAASFPAVEYVAAEVRAAANQPTVTNLRNSKGAAKGPLIQMPESSTTASESKDEAAAVPAATAAASADGCDWAAVPQFSAAEWAALAQCLPMWQLPATDDWKQAYLDASYGALACTRATLTKVLDNSQPPDTLQTACVLDSDVIADISTSMLLSGMKPSETWVTAMEAATAAVFQRVIAERGASAAFSARPAAIVNLMLVAAQCGQPVRLAWLEAALAAAAADDGARPRGDEIAALVFESGRVGMEGGYEIGSQTVGAVTSIASKAQRLWDEQAQLDRIRAARVQQSQQANKPQTPNIQQQESDSDNMPQDMTGFTARGLALLVGGLAKLQALQLMPARWLTTWGDQVVSRAPDFDTAAVTLMLGAASSVGLTLPQRVVHILGGQVIETLHRAGSAAVTGMRPSGPQMDEDDSEEVSPTTVWNQFIDALSGQEMLLPAAWQTPLQDLITYHLPLSQPRDILKALQVLGYTPEPASPSFLRTAVSAFRAKGGLSSPEGCVVLSGLLVSLMADEDMWKEMEAAAISCLPKEASPVSAMLWAPQFKALAIGGVLPSPAYWEGLRGATADTHTLPLPALCELLTGTNTLRMRFPEETDRLSQGWLESLGNEAMKRVCEKPPAEELVALLTAMAQLDAAWQPHMLQDVERVTESYKASLDPHSVSALLVLLTRSGHAPGRAWCDAAVAAIAARVASLDAQDISIFLAGCRALPELRAAAPPRLLPALVEAAGKLAAVNAMPPAAFVSVFQALSGLKESGVQVLSSASGTAGQAISTLLERVQSMREMLNPSEICELITHIRQLNIRPSSRWVTAMFTQIETVDLLDAGPEAPAGVADAADAWGAPVSAALHRGLCVSLVRMTGACGGAARQLESGVIDVGEGDAPPEAMQAELQRVLAGALALLQALANTPQPNVPGEAQANLCGFSKQIWEDLATLLQGGFIPTELHSTLIYSAARIASRARDVAAAAGGAMGAAAAAEYVGASALVRAAVPVTGQCLTEYTPAQLGLVFSSLASMDTVLPGEWLVRFYEYSRPQLSAYSLELLSAVVVGLSQIAPQLPSPPPSVWEQAVYDALVAGADKCQIRDIQTFLEASSDAGFKPPAHVLQTLMDAALSKQQTAAARREEATAAAADAAAPKSAPSQASPDASASDAGAGTGTTEQDNKPLVRSTRTTARRRGAAVATRADSSASSAPSAVQASIAAKAADAAAAEEAMQLAQIVTTVAVRFAYIPDRSWLGVCLEGLTVASKSANLAIEERTVLAQLIKELSRL